MQKGRISPAFLAVFVLSGIWPAALVRVQDTNDNAPHFDKPMYTINMTENTPIGTRVIKLNATDLDEGVNADIIYSFTLYTSEKTQDVFSLNPSTGEITVRGTIDYEDMKLYEMHVEAKDKGLHPLQGQCRVVVHVTDMNDNHPVITIQSVKSTVSEDTPVGTVIALVGISDKDTGDNGKVSLAIRQPHHPFILNESSESPYHYELIVSEPLDRERLAEYDVTLIVTDSGSPALSDNETISVHLLDINDNEPQFPQSFYTIRVMENNAPGSLLSSLTAVDPDLHENQYLVYFIIEREIANTSMSMLFSISPENGKLFALKTFDYEIEKEFLFHIEARDSGVPPLSSNVTVHIIIVDQNDNTPVIVSPWRAHGSVVEEKIPRSTDKGSLVSKVIAIDGDSDSGDNGQIDLTIPTNLPFKLKESSGNFFELIVSESLDREKAPEYEITFTVTDSGSPPLSDNETMTLELLDVNDNVPRFPQSFYTIRVMENNAPGALLDTLTAYDPDLHENQYLVYFIIEREIANTSMSMLFSISPENGKLYALKTFDHEIEKEFLFHIEARDSGVPPLSSNVTVHIIIVDQNDNTPVIVSPWRAHGSVVEEKIPRSTDKGSLVSKVIAIDGDSVLNSRITYQFLQVTDATLFSLDQYNGEIRTMRMFSYRDPRLQRLVVVAKDNGEPALSATVTIKLSTVETAVKAYSDMTEVPLEYDIFSDLNLYLVIGLGSVSFLLLITILVTIVLKCQKPKSSKAAPPCRNSVVSERNSFADSTLVSNDAYWYSMFLAETRKGKLVVRQPAPKGSRYIVSSLPRSTGLTETSGSAPSTLQVRTVCGAVLSFKHSGVRSRLCAVSLDVWEKEGVFGEILACTRF
uniref:Protocadherin b n=1 Tax=Gadus morhua TaxID=8049 RepID=A0A8C5A437_GADMO